MTDQIQFYHARAHLTSLQGTDTPIRVALDKDVA